MDQIYQTGPHSYSNLPGATGQPVGVPAIMSQSTYSSTPGAPQPAPSQWEDLGPVRPTLAHKRQAPAPAPKGDTRVIYARTLAEYHARYPHLDPTNWYAQDKPYGLDHPETMQSLQPQPLRPSPPARPAIPLPPPPTSNVPPPPMIQLASSGGLVTPPQAGWGETIGDVLLMPFRAVGNVVNRLPQPGGR